MLLSLVFTVCALYASSRYTKSLIFGSHIAIKKNQCNPSVSASSFPSLNLVDTSSSYDHKLGAGFVCH
jgi:hypothetical protein